MNKFLNEEVHTLNKQIEPKESNNKLKNFFLHKLETLKKQSSIVSKNEQLTDNNIVNNLVKFIKPN